MQNILDQFNAAPQEFRPRTVPECFALTLAARLGDLQNLHHYLLLSGEHPRGKLLSAYRRTVASGQYPTTIVQFREELGNTADLADDDESKVLALKAERRTIAIAGFTGDRLDFTEVLHLSSNRDRAFTCAVGFLSKAIAHFRPDSAAVEVPEDEDTQRADIIRTLVALLRRHFLPVWSVGKKALFSTFGSPAIKTRDEYREVAGSIWPLPPRGGVHFMERDSALLGLYVQLERLFMPQLLTIPA